MATTFQKRQKEMKRAEKAREKAEKRAQRKIARNEGGAPIDDEIPLLDAPLPLESEPQN
jgi:threonyl-tRNA synthetase